MTTLRVLGLSFEGFSAWDQEITKQISISVKKNGAVKVCLGPFSTTRNQLVKDAIKLANQDKTLSLDAKIKALSSLKDKLSISPEGKIKKWRQTLGNLFYNRTKALTKTISSLENERDQKMKSLETLCTKEADHWLKEKKITNKNEATWLVIQELSKMIKELLNNKKFSRVSQGLTDHEKEEALLEGCKKSLQKLESAGIKSRDVEDMYANLMRGLKLT